MDSRVVSFHTKITIIIIIITIIIIIIIIIFIIIIMSMPSDCFIEQEVSHCQDNKRKQSHHEEVSQQDIIPENKCRCDLKGPFI